MANAFRNDSYQSWRRGSTRSIRVAARDGFEVSSDIGLHAAPSLRQLPISNRFSIDAKQQGRLASAARLWCRRLRMRPIFDHGGKRNMVGARKSGT
jgi:transcriptional regulator GlxA family with amidase domain